MKARRGAETRSCTSISARETPACNLVHAQSRASPSRRINLSVLLIGWRAGAALYIRPRRRSSRSTASPMTR